MPTENPGLLVYGTSPYNAETRLDRLRQNIITPAALFYVRSHGNIPAIDPARYRLAVGGKVAVARDFSLDDLASGFPQREITAVLQCAGNRRADLHAIAPVSGDPWQPGAIGNAIWSGVRLADVLRAAGVEEGADLHVAFACHDDVTSEDEHFRFGVSIPLAKALTCDVLLASAMNGVTLPPEHGFPLRVITPGYAGVRSPKWLASITVQDTPSANPMQQRDYRLIPAGVTRETVDWSQGIAINDMPLNSAICEPADGAHVAAGPVTIRGYAIATERTVVRVDLSLDRGQTWHQATLEGAAVPNSWIFWHAELTIPAGTHQLTVRAWDSAGQTQPAAPQDVWNFRGYLSAAWHRIEVIAS